MPLRRQILLIGLALAAAAPVLCQTEGHPVFKDRRVINAQSVETLPARKLDVRISHRFGDIAGVRGGYETLFGLDNAVDILIGLEYGLSDKIDIGLFRAKGAGAMPDGSAGLRQLLNGTIKWRFITQDDAGGAPFSAAFTGLGTLSIARRAVDNDLVINSFPSFAHRLAYHSQILIARQFSPGFALQIMPGYTYRNLTPFNDVNGIVSLGMAARVQMNKVFGLIADAVYPITGERTVARGFYAPIGIGLEIDTGGHVFQVNFTNAAGIMETDYIPYTTSNWLDGGFRLGFTISRIFNL
jgi:hypothetical protein